ncbi:MAG: Crp/Fnr family transcriptional regulator [Alphaproteobacteria bacterium]|mgnify:FL=1|nr:Crp/Fnr family transcriptional regulator [Alphaproteobacteria bacterium]MBT4020428.1 Crp/Fnr family transcriptional regulator [Alphaproteobacteria bacterium]MBT5159782.1 Crp/Fnr family transcriptional regulator [Alphaproteobacteria bacterium]MBT6386964.1 Crp/Fnr family transcriptional regulator [Alphaproteobacteria bacterium]
MSINEEVELLRQIPLFAKIEPSKLKLLAFTSERLKFKADEELFHQGDIGDSAYIVIGGQADVILSTDRGEVVVSTVKRNDIVGEVAILCDVPRTASVKAKEDLEVLKISKDLFFRMISEFPQMSVEIMRELAARLYRTTDQLMRAVSQN